MKRIICLLACLVMIFSCASCAKRTKPAIVIKHESVTSLEFKRTVFSADDPTLRSYFQKTITESEDVEKLICWIEDLKLEKHSAIEVPIEKVQYVIVLKGVKDHRLVFMDNYVIFDSTAYTYKDPDSMSEVGEKYNLSNYSEKSIASLGII
ncbi:MAG: hypothetical protein IJ408_02630 [Clostridia bacterium]|nr:hypothetical protein [Clostridia bacterium]